MKAIQKYRPAIASFFLMIAVSVTSTALSFFNFPVSQELGVGMGSLTLYCSICGLTGAIAMTFVGKALGSFGPRKLLLIAALWTGIGLFLYSFSNSLWMFYLVAGFTGILCSSALTLCANVIVQTHYRSAEAAALIGVVMAGTGVGGMLFSAVMPWILEEFGWRWGYRILGICWFSIVFLARIILGNPDSQKEDSHITPESTGMTRAQAFKSPMLYLALAAMLLLALGSGISQHIPTILTTSGLSNAQISSAMSLYTGMLAFGKIGQGILYSKAGLVKGGALTHILMLAGFLLLALTAATLPALVLLAIGMGIATTYFPILCKQLFGQREYAQIYSYVSMVLTIGSFVSTPVWGVIYDTTGSYGPGCIVLAALITIAFLCEMIAMHIGSSKKHIVH